MFADPPVRKDGNCYIFHLANGETFKLPIYQSLTIGTDTGTQTVPKNGTTDLTLAFEGEYEALVAHITPEDEHTAISTRAAGSWSVTASLADKKVTVTTSGAEGKAVLDVSLIRTDGSKLTASRVLEAINLVDDGAVITTADDDYVMRGDYTQGITINAENVTLTLENATLHTSGIGINVTKSATIKVSGADNAITGSEGAGIYVAEGSTVTIKGNKESDVLKVTGNGGGCGIGGYVRDGYPYDAIPCGNIVIENITLYAYSSPSAIDDLSPGIGGASGGACGTITIRYATVHAYGNITYDGSMTSSGIGNGISRASETSQIPITNIYNSKIHAHRGVPGNSADYIGGSSYRNGMAGDGASTINLGGGKCTGSTVYCYTGDTLDKTVVYDASGNIK